MTFKEFVALVEAQLQAKGLSSDVVVSQIDWDRYAFGSSIPSDAVPDVYVNVMEDGAIVVTED